MARNIQLNDWLVKDSRPQREVIHWYPPILDMDMMPIKPKKWKPIKGVYYLRCQFCDKKVRLTTKSGGILGHFKRKHPNEESKK